MKLTDVLDIINKRIEKYELQRLSVPNLHRDIVIGLANRESELKELRHDLKYFKVNENVLEPLKTEKEALEDAENCLGDIE